MFKIIGEVFALGGRSDEKDQNQLDRLVEFWKWNLWSILLKLRFDGWFPIMRAPFEAKYSWYASTNIPDFQSNTFE